MATQAHFREITNRSIKTHIDLQDAKQHLLDSIQTLRQIKAMKDIQSIQTITLDKNIQTCELIGEAIPPHIVFAIKRNLEGVYLKRISKAKREVKRLTKELNLPTHPKRR